MKYASLADVKAAYESGELDKNEHIIMLDNDCTSLYVNDEILFEGGNPEDLLQEALDLLGIPAEGV